jgi:hypothetical protein
MQRIGSNRQTPAIAFQHIPTSAEAFTFREDCSGHAYEGVESVVSDSNLIEALPTVDNMHFCLSATITGMITVDQKIVVPSPFAMDDILDMVDIVHSNMMVGDGVRVPGFITSN